MKTPLGSRPYHFLAVTHDNISWQYHLHEQPKQLAVFLMPEAVNIQTLSLFSTQQPDLLLMTAAVANIVFMNNPNS